MRASLCPCTFSFKVSVDRFEADSLLVEGSELPDPVRFNRALADLMTRVA